MRKLCTAMLVAGAALWIIPGATAEDAPAAKPGAAASQDPNYRWHNGQWWYWVQKDQSWRVWSGDQWLPLDQARAQGAVRSFSYQPQAAPQTGGRVSFQPGTTMNRPIVGSFGNRSAASKVLGNY